MGLDIWHAMNVALSVLLSIATEANILLYVDVDTLQ